MIPERTKETIDNYVTKGLEPGGFVHAVLANDLKGALGQADAMNRECLFAIVGYVYSFIPHNAHGSYEIVQKWISDKNRKVEYESENL